MLVYKVSLSGPVSQYILFSNYCTQFKLYYRKLEKEPVASPKMDLEWIFQSFVTKLR